VFEFGGYHGRGDFVPELSKVVIKLEPGAKITGPAVWREIPAAADQVPAVAEKPSLRGSIIEVGIIVGCLGLTAFMSPMIAGITTLFIIALSGALALMFKAEGARIRSISKLGSVYVYAPVSRTTA
jgi:hypothetical protein